MNKEMKNKLVPKLRFKEFEGNGEWKETTLKDISQSIFDGTHQTPKYTNSGIPFFSVENLVSGSKNKFISLEDYRIATSKNKPEKNDILLTRIGNIGFSKVVDWDYDFSVYVTLAVIKKSDSFNTNYLHSFLQSTYYQKEIKSKSLLNAVPCKINMDELRKTKVLLPPDIQKLEQQKIADCLSSLDDLISAETEKLDALKEHKKGLMQQLFPVEGEKVPKLRFPEFKDSGDWGECSFNDLLSSIIDFRGRTPIKLGMNWGGGDIISLSANNVKNGYIDYNAGCHLGSDELYSKWMGKVNLEKGDIVFTMEAPLGNALLIPDNRNYILSQRVVAFKTKSGVNNKFFIQLIWGSQFQNEIEKLSTGSTAKGINQKRLNSLKLLFPKTINEQQLISDMLESIDDEITSQLSKVRELKLHKKGLMQQLFPTIN